MRGLVGLMGLLSLLLVSTEGAMGQNAVDGLARRGMSYYNQMATRISGGGRGGPGGPAPAQPVGGPGGPGRREYAAWASV